MENQQCNLGHRLPASKFSKDAYFMFQYEHNFFCVASDNASNAFGIFVLCFVFCVVDWNAHWFTTVLFCRIFSLRSLQSKCLPCALCMGRFSGSIQLYVAWHRQCTKVRTLYFTLHLIHSELSCTNTVFVYKFAAARAHTIPFYFLFYFLPYNASEPVSPSPAIIYFRSIFFFRFSFRSDIFNKRPAIVFRVHATTFSASLILYEYGNGTTYGKLTVFLLLKGIERAQTQSYRVIGQSTKKINLI